MPDFTRVPEGFRRAAICGRQNPGYEVIAAYNFLLGWFAVAKDPEYDATIPYVLIPEHSNWSA